MSFDPEKHVLINVYVSSRYIGTEESEYYYVDKEKWESESEENKSSILDDLYNETVNNYIEGSRGVVTNEKEIRNHGEEAQELY